MPRALLAAVCAILLHAASAAAAPTVAVMAFRDLSATGASAGAGAAGGRSGVGEGIRETVTADLKQLSDVRVVERGAIDSVLAEQKLQSTAELDPETSARIGKLLGATLIVTGAYQKAAPQIRLTARFVRVETGEVVGTAKVDGRETEFLRLQDRVTAELLKSAGLAAHAKSFALRARPPMKSLRTLDLYGQSLFAQNDDARRQLLQQALAEDATFTYASADLAALEKRMKSYQARSDAEVDRRLAADQAALAQEKDPDKARALAFALMNGLMLSRRYHALRAVARAVIDHPPPLPANPMPGVVSADETAGFYLVTANGQLKDDDALLHDGEAFLKSHPASPYFSSAKAMMDQAIERKRKSDDGREGAKVELAKLSEKDKWDLCRVARVYVSAAQHKEAQHLFRACIQAGKTSEDRKWALRDIIFADINSADFGKARQDLATLEREDPETYRSLKMAFEMQIPAD